MAQAAQNVVQPTPSELPATAYAHHHHIFRAPSGPAPTGLLFDSRYYAIMSIVQPPAAQTPDMNTDKDGDRVLVLIEGDFALQIGEARYRLQPGDAIQIPRGQSFGRSSSEGGAHLLMIRAKAMRSFAMYR